MEHVFKKEITFISKVPVELEAGGMGWNEEPITKEAVFKELSRTDRTQHKLVFKIMSVFENFGGVNENGTSKIKIDSDALYDLTVKAIQDLLIVDKVNITEEDKAEFLNDSGAILQFGLWLLGDKIAPFFSKIKLN